MTPHPTKALWLHIASSGKCTTHDLTQNFPYMRFMGKMLNDMHRSGLVKRCKIEGPRHPPHMQYAYLVDNECSLPKSLKLGEVLELRNGT